MRRLKNYEAELAWLPETYTAALAADLQELEDAVATLMGSSAYFVASGGALAVAQLAARTFEERSRRSGYVMTPLEFSATDPTCDAGVVLFSASGQNPDALAALRFAREGAFQPIVLLTHRLKPFPFGQRAEPILRVGFNAPFGRDGFLATNSVLFMATVWLRALGYGRTLAPELPPAEQQEALRDSCIILTAPGLAAAATDLETRLSELGLSSAQVTDYRNFAHGRHYGLYRTMMDTTVVALRAHPYEDLAINTIALLPSGCDIRSLSTQAKWPMSVVDLLTRSMALVGATAAQRGVKPSRPGVPSFGQRLYRLNYRRLLPARTCGPVQKKLRAACAPETDESIREVKFWLEDWLENISRIHFSALVLDFDGTVCTTPERYSHPEEPIRKAIIKLLEDGIPVGFATGRGGSLWSQLREWIPRSLWSDVLLGLYNGGLIFTLSEPFPDDIPPAAGLAEARALLENDRRLSNCRLHARPLQLRVHTEKRSNYSAETLTNRIREILQTTPDIDCRVVSSGHSVDIVPNTSSKRLVSAQLSARGEVLLIGDQGQVGGNDFALLASSEYSLTVDRCSGDATRCWNLGFGSARGPILLLRYLRSMSRAKAGFRIQSSALVPKDELS